MKNLLLFISLLLSQTIFAQTKFPVIKATSKTVSINDGGVLNKDTWTLSPGARPDVFTADRTRQTKYVTFYTDIDSIKVKVKPGTRFNFVVLYNGKDSCFTQIASAIPPESLVKNNVIQHDTIPFTLSAFSAIAIKTVINNTDTLTLDFDISSFDFHLTRDAILKKTSLLSNQPDALSGKAKPNYNHLNKVFKLQMGGLILNNPEVLTTNINSEGMDGRLGYNVFEGKQVEIDYDHNLLIVHSQLPANLKGYTRSKIEFTHSFGTVKGTFEIAGKSYTGDFSMDTGSNGALILDSAWAGRYNFKDLKLLKTSVLRDPRGTAYQFKLVQAPAFKINGFALSNIPTLILGNKNPVGFEMNYLGNDLLKRFNMILDLKNDYLYLKPNKLMNVKYRENS